MKRIVGVFCAVLAASVAVSVAAGANIAPSLAWPEPKAERMLEKDGRIGLQSSEKVSLEEQLHRGAAVFRGLQMWALDEGDEAAWWTYHHYANRYESALRAVQRGLSIEAAQCDGSGRAVQGGRYRQFYCLATSVVLRIPTAQPESTEGTALPTVVEGEARSVGPFLTQIEVRVTGKSTFAYE
jgi:hypothetical protein